MIGFRLALFALTCVAVLVALLLATVWLRGLRAAPSKAPSRDSMEEPVDFVEGEFRRVDNP
ncbi:MAG: hypothetical protein HDKAJFGB_02466 [Anaerolineae bacterium]|nr:hypothetical protein [Anaerolineae bacterium]RIK30877.1 MAG: hypothetical protein DCC52_06205 [Chloroflexota bacterium]